MSRPDLAIILGAMKAGTTTLFERLARHPDAVRPNQKEPSFFSHDEQWERGAEHYFGLWPDDVGDRTLLEASAAYTKRPRFPDTFDRMRRFVDERGLEIRFVYSLRDPIERTRSQITHEIAGGKKKHKLVDAMEGDLAGHTLCPSMYAMQIDDFLRRFDRDQLLLVRFDELRKDTDRIVEEAATFLGLDPGRLGKGKRQYNPSVGKYEKSKAWSLAETVGLDRLTGLLPEGALDSIRDALGERIEGKFEFTEAQEQAHLHALEADLIRLRDVHGVDISRWTLPPGIDEG